MVASGVLCANALVVLRQVWERFDRLGLLRWIGSGIYPRAGGDCEHVRAEPGVMGWGVALGELAIALWRFGFCLV